LRARQWKYGGDNYYSPTTMDVGKLGRRGLISLFCWVCNIYNFCWCAGDPVHQSSISASPCAPEDCDVVVAHASTVMMCVMQVGFRYANPGARSPGREMARPSPLMTLTHISSATPPDVVVGWWEGWEWVRRGRPRPTQARPGWGLRAQQLSQCFLVFRISCVPSS